MLFEMIAFAEGTAADTSAAADAAAADMSAGLMSTTAVQFIILALMLVGMYFILIRPQRKREKETQEMIAAVKVGDKIVTIGGIAGKITKIKDEFVFIESGSVGNPNEKSFLKIERSAIKSVEKKQQA